jgi:CRISPR-associated protein Cas2
MLIAVAYDVPDDRRRTRLAKVLEDFGHRVQDSVFECLLTADQTAALHRRIRGEIDEQADSVRIYRICAECAERVEVLGWGTVSEDPDVYIL